METLRLLYSFSITRFSWFPWAAAFLKECCLQEVELHFEVTSQLFPLPQGLKPVSSTASRNFIPETSVFYCQFLSSQHYVKCAYGTLIRNWGFNICKKKCALRYGCITFRLKGLLIYWCYLFVLQVIWSSADAERGISSVLGRLDAGGFWRLSSDGSCLSETGRYESHLSSVKSD